MMEMSRGGGIKLIEIKSFGMLLFSCAWHCFVDGLA